MELTTQKREKTGKANKGLRNNRELPAVIFGKGMESINVSVGYNDFVKVYSEAGETELIDLKMDKDNYKVLVKDVQINPITDEYIHAGFYKPNLKEKIEVAIPLVLEGEEDNVLIKSGDAVAITLYQEITVSALPTDLPKEFIVNVAELKEIGATITAAQLQFDRNKVELVDIEDDEDIIKFDHATLQEEDSAEVSEEEAIASIEATEESEKDEEEKTE